MGLKKLSQFINILFEPSDHVALWSWNETGRKNIITRTIEKKKLELESRKIINQGIFFGPNPIKKRKTRSIKNIETLNAFFVDIDNRSLPEQIEPKPHFVLTRDATHHYLIWLIERQKPTTKNLKAFTKVEQELISKFGADEAAKDPARLLRLPFTNHYKEGKKPGYKIVKYNKLPRYNPNEFLKILKPKVEVSAGGELEFLKKFYNRKTVSAGDGRSLFLYHLGLDCHSWGIEKNDALELAQEINETKCDPPEENEIVEHQIESAYRYAKGEFGEYKKGEGAPEQKKLKKDFEKANKTRDKLTNFLYVHGAERLINLETGSEYTTDKQINNFLSHLIADTMTINWALKKQVITTVDKMDFRPDIKERIFKEGEISVFNRYKEIEKEIVKPDKKAVKVFLDHVEYLTTTKEEKEFLLQFFAFIVQNPGKKVMWAPLIISKNQRIGKSLLEKLFKNIFERYVGSVENERLNQNWTHHFSDKLLVFVHEVFQEEKYTTVNKMKNYITDSTIEIEGKYARPYTIQNTVNFILFSNSRQALALDKFDKRFFVVYNEKEKKDSEYYRRLVTTFDEAYMSIYSFLISYDISKFDPYAPPIETQGKKDLVENNLSELSMHLNEAIENEEGCFEYPAVLLADIQRQVSRFSSPLLQRTSLRQIKNYLMDHDYKPVNVEKRIGKVRVHKTFWVEPGGKLTDEIILKVLNEDQKEEVKV